jgi:UDP-N-acetylglucosamine 2-epimerase (non-hydrolysing)
MPEEVNRIMVDHISDYLFCVSYFDKRNLDRENVKRKKGRQVFIVGDTMLDSLKFCEARFSQSDILSRLGVRNYILSTIHRPANVDDEKRLSRLLDKVENVTKTHKIVFPMHPRTRKMISAMGRLDHLKSNPNFIITEPLDYFDFMQLQKNAKLLLTDSGSIQAEASAFGIPCLTLRRNTERPHTLVKNGGTNKLIGISPRNLLETIDSTLSSTWAPKVPDYKDSGLEIARRIMD